MSKNKKRYFSIGDEVACKYAPTVLMVVKDIKMRKSMKTKTVYDNSSGEFKTEKQEFKEIVGIQTYWFEEEKKYKTDIFHTQSLIPWEVAQKGKKEIEEFILNS